MHFSFNFFSVSCNLNVCSSMLRQITIQIPHVCSFRKQQNVCVPTVHLFLEQEEYITFMHFLSPPSLQCFGNDVRNHFPLALLKSGLKKIRGTFSCIHCNKNLFGVRAVLDQILNRAFNRHALLKCSDCPVLASYQMWFCQKLLKNANNYTKIVKIWRFL